MLRILGAVLIVGCSTLLGVGVSSRSRQRIRALRSLLESLPRLKAELEGLLTPLPTLLALLTREAAQPASELYGAAALKMEKKALSFRAAWEQAVEETEALCLLPEELRALRALGAVLGRSDAATQAAAVDRTVKQLSLFLELEEKDRTGKNRVHAALGAGAGVMLALLLL